MMDILCIYCAVETELCEVLLRFHASKCWIWFFKHEVYSLLFEGSETEGVKQFLAVQLRVTVHRQDCTCHVP